MKNLLNLAAVSRRQFSFAILVLLGVVIVIKLWLGVDPRDFETAIPADSSRNVSKIEKPQDGEKWSGVGA